MKEQYFKIYKNDFKAISDIYNKVKSNSKLKKSNNEQILKEPNKINVLLELTILSVMRDRIKSSRRNLRFYDNRGKAYVIFTYNEIMTKLHCTGRSCTKSLNDLKENNFISTKRTYDGPTKYYINNKNGNTVGYYKLYYRYFNDFDNDLKCIYAYMIIKDLQSLSKYETYSITSKYNFIDENGRYFVIMNISDLSSMLKCSFPTCSRIINQLEENGYIKRKRRKNSASRIYLIK